MKVERHRFVDMRWIVNWVFFCSIALVVFVRNVNMNDPEQMENEQIIDMHKVSSALEMVQIFYPMPGFQWTM